MNKDINETQISIISVISNRTICKNWLEKNLSNQQNISYEFIPIFNEGNSSFQNVRDALNYAAEKAKGKYILFVHQDVILIDSDVLYKSYESAESLNNFGVIGVAGCPEGKQWKILTTIIQGEKGDPLGECIDEPCPVMSVDECYFLIKKSTWNDLHFSKKSGWHLYAVEYCLKMLDLNKQNYVIPLNLWHGSAGASLDANYCVQLNDFLKEYKDKYKYINTTVKQWSTSFWGRKIYLPYYREKQKLKKIVLRNNR